MNYSFKKGWSQIRQKDMDEVRGKIMKALNILSKPSFYNRLNGSVEPKISEAKDIEQIFNEFGITEIWDEDEPIDPSI